MYYYFKLEILSGYHTEYIEVREIQFFNNNTIIPISNLSVVGYSSQYDTNSWNANNIINGDINSTTTGWCTARTDVKGAYIIIRSTQKFNKVLIYNDSQGTYAIKDCRLYYCNSNINPSAKDTKWILSNETRYPSGSSVQTEFIKRNKLLIQDGNNLDISINGTDLHL